MAVLRLCLKRDALVQGEFILYHVRRLNYFSLQLYFNLAQVVPVLPNGHYIPQKRLNLVQ